MTDVRWLIAAAAVALLALAVASWRLLARRRRRGQHPGMDLVLALRQLSPEEREAWAEATLREAALARHREAFAEIGRLD